MKVFYVTHQRENPIDKADMGTVTEYLSVRAKVNQDQLGPYVNFIANEPGFDNPYVREWTERDDK